MPATTSLRPGILAYLTKPFDEPDLRHALERAMVWHDAAVASGAQLPSSADADAGLQAWLDTLESHIALAGASRPVQRAKRNS